jgi:hypothetical protein
MESRSHSPRSITLPFGEILSLIFYLSKSDSVTANDVSHKLCRVASSYLINLILNNNKLQQRLIEFFCIKKKKVNIVQKQKLLTNYIHAN